VLTRLPLNDTARDHAEDVATQIDADRRLKVVLDAVDKLPKGERQAVELCLLGELSTAETAEVLGIAEVSVRARISRARSRLRGLLGGMGLEEGR
jgi:RNA polymerase sigma-70 factor (ECF subfamily)